MATETPIGKTPVSSDVFYTPKSWTRGIGIGLLAGFFGGVVGQGGGVVAVPLMTGLANITQHQAHGTSLVMVAATGIVGALSYYHHPPTRVRSPTSTKAENENESENENEERKEEEVEVLHGIDFGAALLMCMGASLFARLGAVYTKHMTGRALKKTMGVFMLTSSIAVASKAAYLHFFPKTPITSTTTASEEREGVHFETQDNIIDTQQQEESQQKEEEEEVQNKEAEAKPPVKLSRMAESYVNRWHIFLATGCITGFAAGMLVRLPPSFL